MKQPLRFSVNAQRWNQPAKGQQGNEANTNLTRRIQ